MPVALDPGGTVFDYVVEEDLNLPQEERTKWHLRRLKLHELKAVERLQNSFRLSPDFADGDEKTIETQVCELNYSCEVLHYGLEGVENFKDKEGKMVELVRGKKNRIPDAFLERAQLWIIELANAVMAGSRVSEEQAKNSS